MPTFKNMRQRVEYAYDELNVDIFYEGDYMYTILDHSCEEFIEMLTEEELDHELSRIWMNMYCESALNLDT